MDAWLVVLILGQMTFFAFFLWILIRTRQETLRRRSEERLRILERFSSDQELAAFLGQPAGRELLNQFGGHPTHPGRWILLATATAILLLFGGGGFFFLAAREPDFIVPAALMLTSGFGTLVATGVSFVLGRKFGIFSPEESKKTSAEHKP